MVMQAIEEIQTVEQVRLLIEAAMSGEDIFLTQNKSPILELKPVQKKRHAGSMKGRIWLADDFDAPLDDFREYME